jgi:hypothetical protein
LAANEQHDSREHQLESFEPEEHPRLGFFYSVRDDELGEQLLSLCDIAAGASSGERFVEEILLPNLAAEENTERNENDDTSAGEPRKQAR